MDIVNLLVALGAGALTGSLVTKKHNQNQLKPLHEKKKKVNQKTTNEMIQVNPKVTERLDALEDLLETKQTFSTPKNWIIVKPLVVKEGVRYYFHYLNFPHPFLLLTYQKDTKRVTHQCIMKELTQDKKRLRNIITRLSEKIIEEQAKDGEHVIKE